MAKRLQNFTEDTYQSKAPEKVDREAGVIRGVKILGSSSKNGREYGPQALKDAAALYENMSVNANHPSRSTPNANRTIEEGLGWLENVTVKPDGVYGDLNIIKAHPMANSLFEVAERNPSRFGLSHNASGEVTSRGGKMIVENIKGMRSVDVVQNPATVKSFFESGDPVATQKLSNILEQMQAGSGKSHLLKLIEMDGSPLTPDMAMPIPDEADNTDPYAAVIEAGVLAVCRDESLDAAGKLAKIKALFGLAEKMSEPAAAPATDKPKEDAPVSESLQEEFNALKAKLEDRDATDAARELLESSKVKVTPARLSTIKRADKNERKELLEDWVKADGPAPKTGVNRPAVSKPAPLLEADEGYKPPKGVKAMAAAYR